MGIRGKFFLVIAATAVGVGVATYTVLNRSHQSLIEKEAVRIAEIVATQVVSDRAEYTQALVGKLVKDGAGAAQDSAGRPGYIPLPAQFVRNVAARVAGKAGGLYSYSLVSLWNLNPAQGLKDDFDRWAWKQLEEQDQTFAQTPAPAAGYPWKAVYRFENVNGEEKLVYMKADPAAAQACVTCHNQYEQRPEWIATRQSAGVAPGKTWRLHQLMGALRVEIPVGQVAALAAAGRNQTLGILAAILLLGFGMLLGLIYRAIIRPVEWSVQEVEGFTTKVDAVVVCSKDLVQAADAQAEACRAAQEVLQAGEVATTTQSLEALARVANGNAMRAEDSAVYCNQLNDSFSGLRARLREMVHGS